MPLYQANVAFDHGGVRVEVGDIVDDGHYLYTLFPSNFTIYSEAVSSTTVTATTSFTASAGTVVAAGGSVTVSGLGTADPSSAGVLWDNGGTLMVSGGA